MAAHGAAAAASAVAPGVEQVVELFQNQRYRKFKVSNAIGSLHVCPVESYRRRTSRALLVLIFGDRDGRREQVWAEIVHTLKAV